MFEFLRKYLLGSTHGGDGSASAHKDVLGRQELSVETPPVSAQPYTWPDATELLLPSLEKINLARVSLRPYQPSDIDKVLFLERPACEANWLRELQEFLSSVERKESSCEVAMYRDSLVGFIIYQRDARGYEIQKLAVNAGCQRNGIGTLLVRNLTDSLSTIDDIRAIAISTTVQEQNLEAQMFFKRLGFGASIVKTFGSNDRSKYLFTNRPPGREFERKKLQIQQKSAMRWMIRKDMDEVLAIDRQNFQNPWSEDDFCAALRQRNCIGQVVELDQRIVGYVIYDIQESAFSIIKMAVDPNLQRLGIGSKILQRMKHKLSQERRSSLIIEVGASDEAGQAFLRKAEFKADAVLRKKDHQINDYAFRMRYSLSAQKTIASS